MSAAELINAVGLFLYIAILARAMLSWFPMGRQTTNPITQFIHFVTEPIMMPIRKVVPRTGMFDFTPMIAIILIGVIQRVLLKFLS